MSVRWTRTALVVVAFLVMGAASFAFLNYYQPPRPAPAAQIHDSRLERACRDVALKITMAEGWLRADRDHAETAKTMLVTLGGVRAICAEAPPTVTPTQ